MRYWIAKFMYKTTWRISRGIFRFFLNWKAVYEDESTTKKLKEGRQPVLIISNHVSWADPFMLSVAFPNLFPVRHLAHDKLFRVPVKGQIIWIYGSLKLDKRIGIESALQESLQILHNNGVVGMFPQGRRTKTNRGRKRKARRGVGYLIKHSNPLVIPVYIQGGINMRLKEVIFRKRNITIKVGVPFKYTHSSEEDYKQISAQVWKSVEELSNI